MQTLAQAFQSGVSTPSEVAETILLQLAASEQQEPCMSLLLAQNPKDLRAHAHASSMRRVHFTLCMPTTAMVKA